MLKLDHLGRRATIALVGVLLAGVSACGDSGAVTGLSENFDPEKAAEAMQSLTSSADDDSDLLISLDLAGDALPGDDLTASVVQAASVEDPVARRLGELAGTLSRSGIPGPAFAILPETLLGSTFVWDPAEDRYVVDPERTDAPADGIRFVLYAIDPLTRQPVEPLVVVGYVDVIDVSTDTSEGLRIVAVDTSGDTDVTLIDYTVEGSLDESGEFPVATLTASGFISDGTEQLDFDLVAQVVFTGTNSADLSVDYSLSKSGEDRSARLLIEASVVDGVLTDGSIDLTLSDGVDTVTLAVAVDADGNLDGSVTFNGTEVIVIGGTTASPTFTRPDGSALSDSERQALSDLWEAIGDILDFGDGVFELFRK